MALVNILFSQIKYIDMKLRFPKIYLPFFLTVWQMQGLRRISIADLRTTFSGFPLIWQRNFCCSFSREIYIVPMLLNVLFWATFSYFASNYILKIVKGKDNIIAFIIGIWTTGVFSLCLIFWHLLISDIDFCWWRNYNFERNIFF